LHPGSKLASAPVGSERDDARDDRIGPDLASARRLLGVAGRLISDARVRDLVASGKAGAIEADFLVSEVSRLPQYFDAFSWSEPTQQGSLRKFGSVNRSVSCWGYCR
jgi:hypothetical protein